MPTARTKGPPPLPEQNPALLDALRKLLDGMPRPVQGSPSAPGIFPGGKGGAALLAVALEAGFIENVVVPAPVGPKPKKAPPGFARITEKGKKAVLASDSPLKAIEGLRELLKVQATAIEGAAAALPRQLAEWREALSHLERSLRDQIDGYRQTSQLLVQSLDKIANAPPEPAVPVAPPTAASADWLDEVVRFVREVKQRNSFARPTLPQVYEEVKKLAPNLTLGQFHDGLRTLQEQRRILLGPHTQNLAAVPDARNALYLDREVKFYVDLP